MADYKGKFTGKEIDDILSFAKNNMATLTISISGDTTINTKGAHAYTVSYGLSDATKTINVLSATATLDKEYDNVSLSNVSSTGFSLNVSAFNTDENVVVRFEVAEKNSGTSYQEITIALDAITATSATISGADAIGTVGDYDYTIALAPSNVNVAVSDITATVTNGLTVKSINKDSMKVTINCNSIPDGTKTYTLNAIVTMADGTEVTCSKSIRDKVIPSVTINGTDSFEATNGEGSSDYTFAYSPTDHDSTVEVVNVTTNNSGVTASNVTTSGFTLNVTGLTADTNITITTKLKFNGSLEKTYTKSISITYVEKAAGYNAGDVLCSDGTVVSPTINADGYTIDALDLGGKTAIGVCVVPTSHCDDGNARFMSLKSMSLTDPENGSTTETSIYWGNSSTDLSLTNHAEANRYCGSATSINRMTTLCDDGYYRYNTSDIVPFPYNADGSANSKYRGSTMRTCDMDGQGNTDVIIEAVTASWESGEITNSTDSGNYPAACCCRRYAPSGYGKGEWYLPSSGELGYAVAKLQMLNNVISEVSGVQLSTYFYWSSSEYSSGRALGVAMNDGYVNYSSKSNYNYVRAFLAF